MGFTLLPILAVATGLLLGVAARGRPRYVSEHPISGVGLLAGGLVLQAASGLAALRPLATAALLASYALLVAFAVVNLRLVGMGLVTLGLAANLLVIAVNGGMPVRGSSIVAAHGASPAQVPRLHFGTKRHLEGPADHLTVLADVIPVPQANAVVSFGDLVIAIGIADVLFHLLRPRRSSRAAPANA
jgi:hypothetical protein